VKAVRFFRQAQSDAKLWAFCVFLLALFRAALIFGFREQLSAAGTWRAILMAMLNGMRYDSMIAAYFASVPLLLSCACLACRSFRMAETARRATGLLFVLLSSIIFVVTLGYFREYNDQFNHFIFGLYYDDAGAVLKTIWSEYHPLLSLWAGAAVAATGSFVFSRWMDERWGVAEDTLATILRGRARKAGAALVLIVLFVGGVRGSFGRRPAQRKDAAVTGDEFLNKTVMNPYTCLRYAVKDHLALAGANGLEAFLPDRDIRGALRLVTGKAERLATVDDYLTKAAGGPRGAVPRHVFLVLMESCEAWPLLAEFEALGIAPQLRRLADGGVSIRPFLPSSSGTMESMAAIITGLPDAGVHTNYRESSRTPYPTAIAATFRKLGYATRMFYGGYLSWQRIADFSRDQGFDEVYGGGHAGAWRSGNEWGVDDEDLFRFVVDTVEDEPRSFNFILTTSFHPPYDIDVRQKGFRLSRIPGPIMRRCGEPPDLKMLGHFWYADHCLGEFVARVEDKLGLPLFAVTGDHAGRRTITRRPTLPEKCLVPFVLYGREVLAGVSAPPGAAGSHIDIAPTLIGLCAPQGATYASLGHDLLREPGAVPGIGRNHAVTNAFVAGLSPGSSPAPLPGDRCPGERPDLDALRRMHAAVHGIGWWRIQVGAELE